MVTHRFVLSQAGESIPAGPEGAGVHATGRATQHRLRPDVRCQDERHGHPIDYRPGYNRSMMGTVQFLVLRAAGQANSRYARVVDALNNLGPSITATRSSWLSIGTTSSQHARRANGLPWHDGMSSSNELLAQDGEGAACQWQPMESMARGPQ